MPDADFQHLKLSMVKDVAVVEIHTKDIQGPQLAQELGHELGMVIAQDWAKRVLIDFHRVAYLSSTGFAAIFNAVSRAKAEGREIRALQDGTWRAASGPRSSACRRSSSSTTTRRRPCAPSRLRKAEGVSCTTGSVKPGGSPGRANSDRGRIRRSS